MDKYPILRKIIVRDFESVSKFAKLTGISKGSLIKLILGKYPAKEQAMKEKIIEAFKIFRVDVNLKGIWRMPPAAKIDFKPVPKKTVVIDLPNGIRYIRAENTEELKKVLQDLEAFDI